MAANSTHRALPMSLIASIASSSFALQQHTARAKRRVPGTCAERANHVADAIACMLILRRQEDASSRAAGPHLGSSARATWSPPPAATRPHKPGCRTIRPCDRC